LLALLVAVRWFHAPISCTIAAAVCYDMCMQSQHMYLCMRV
jgi:hypothetical protein